jgi:hypothetical protein
MQKLIWAGFATAAMASASLPALAWSVWPDVDFEWYANVGRPLSYPTVEVIPAPRKGYIWTAGHWENRGARQVWVAGHWVRDDYADQLAVYNTGTSRIYATGPLVLYDVQGNPIPTDPDAYNVNSARR